VLRSAKAEAEQHAETIAADLIEAKRKVALGEEKFKKEAREGMAVLREKIENLQSEIIRLEDLKKRGDIDYASNMQRVSGECEASKLEASRVGREKEVVVGRAAGLVETIDALKHSIGESESRKKADGKAVRELTKRGDELERENSEIKAEGGEMRKNIDLLQEKIAKLSAGGDRQREEHLIVVNDLKKLIESDREKLKGKMKEESRKLKGKLAREVKKSGAYKEKALEAHQRNVRTRSALGGGGGGELGV